MKKCSRCDRELALSEFTRNRSRKDGLNSACRSCHSQYTKRHYEENKEYYVDKAARHTKRIKEVVRESKLVPCADCKVSYPFYVMDYDHVRGKKTFHLAQARLSGINKVLEEMEKCDVVCANCHRIRTYARASGQLDRPPHYE